MASKRADRAPPNPRKRGTPRATATSELPNAYQHKRTPEREAVFLKALSGTGRNGDDDFIPSASITQAALMAGVGRSTVFEWKDADAAAYAAGDHTRDFHLRWADAEEQGTDQLEAEAQRRAMVGYEKPVYQGGIMVGTVREYSDALMQIMLKGRRKAKYSDRTELTGKDGGPVATSIEVEFVEGPGVKK